MIINNFDKYQQNFTFLARLLVNYFVLNMNYIHLVLRWWTLGKLLRCLEKEVPPKKPLYFWIGMKHLRKSFNIFNITKFKLSCACKSYNYNTTNDIHWSHHVSKIFIDIWMSWNIHTIIYLNLYHCSKMTFIYIV